MKTNKTEKKKLTPEELSRIRSEAGRKGGRAAGYGKGRAPTKTMTVREPDYHIIVNYADAKQISIAEALHRICEGLKAKYPELLTTDG